MSENRRILHLVKTLDGATWAFHQMRELVKRGWEIHVAAPVKTGRHLTDLQRTGATLHTLPVEWPTKSPWKLPTDAAQMRRFVYSLAPRIVHSHFVSTTLMARYALRGTGIPRLFQVPGPLHLEHRLFGMWDTMTADHDDLWIASSQFIKNLYTQGYGVSPERVKQSYYGIDLTTTSAGEGFLRQKYNIPKDAFLVGNVSYFYPPKAHLGQRVGIKGHELMLEALTKNLKTNPDLWAVFIGGPWGHGDKYFQKLKAQAQNIGLGRIIFTGSMPNSEVLKAWREINLAMHVPVSENCGGVVEPLLVSTPVLAASVGGLPEVILDQSTGILVERKAEAIAEGLQWALSNRNKLINLAHRGHEHILDLFDREKTAAQIHALYHTL